MPEMQCPFCDSTHIKMMSFGTYICDFCGRKFSEVSNKDRLPSFDI